MGHRGPFELCGDTPETMKIPRLAGIPTTTPLKFNMVHLKISPWKSIFRGAPIILRFHVKLWGCSVMYSQLSRVLYKFFLSIISVLFKFSIDMKHQVFSTWIYLVVVLMQHQAIKSDGPTWVYRFRPFSMELIFYTSDGENLEMDPGTSAIILKKRSLNAAFPKIEEFTLTSSVICKRDPFQNL